MKNDYLITTCSLRGVKPALETTNFKVYTNKYYPITIKNEPCILIIDGFIIPRSETFSTYCNLTPPQLVETLYSKYDNNFIRFIKGQFVIIIANTSGFTLYNQRSGIKKAFYFKLDNEFNISNSMSFIRKVLNFKPDEKEIINYCLVNSFINGKTCFLNINFTMPGTQIQFDGKLRISHWFKADSLLNIDRKIISYDEIADRFVNLIDKSIRYLKKEKSCLTLTAGMDSRLVLAILCYLGNLPESIVYGNPAARDVIYSSNISQSLGLKENHYYFNGESSLYQVLAEDIIAKGNSLINFHRAHRLFAYKNFAERNWSDGICFTGHLGGELIKNFFYDKIIISPFVESWMKKNNAAYRKSKFKYFTSELFIRNPSKEQEDYLNCMPIFKGDQHQNEFVATFEYLINIHHAQDILLAGDFFDIVYPVFADDEIIELIFTIQNTFYHNNRFNPFIKRIESHKLYCELIDRLSPLLSKIPFGKKGSFTTKEYMNDNRLLFIMKRISRHFSEKEKFAPNFSYGNWFQEYVSKETKSVKENELLNELFDIEAFASGIKSGTHQTNEGYWRKYTNLIFIDKVIRHFENVNNEKT